MDLGQIGQIVSTEQIQTLIAAELAQLLIISAIIIVPSVLGVFVYMLRSNSRVANQFFQIAADQHEANKRATVALEAVSKARDTDTQTWRTTLDTLATKMIEMTGAITELTSKHTSVQTAIVAGFETQAARSGELSAAVGDNSAHMVSLIKSVELLNTGIGELTQTVRKTTVTADVMLTLDRIEKSLSHALNALDKGTATIKKKDTGELKNNARPDDENGTIHLPATSSAGNGNGDPTT